MDVLQCTYSALQTVMFYGTNLSLVVLLQILIEYFRPDIVDRGHRVKIIPTEDIIDNYDFIIIGGGAAGSVLANRLTENENWTVLLLEAGNDAPATTDVPAIAASFQMTDIDWQFKTEPSSTYCLAMNNNQCVLPRGKILGGSSTINYMAYIRGNSKNYDTWRNLGNPGWGYSDVLPYFVKSENMTDPNLRESPFHGTAGYLTVELFRNESGMSKYFLDAGREIGYDEVDVNGESQVGLTRPYGTLRDGLRCSTEKAYLRSASKRKNLYVSTQSMAEKILVNEIDKTAYGVQFTRAGETFTVYTNNEVILSAGTIQSPQILMLSGIGPKEHLEEVGVEFIHDLPGVGQNFQDHVGVGGMVYLIDIPADVDSVTVSSITASEVDKFLCERNGSLYTSTSVDVLGFVNTRYANKSLNFPDIEIYLGAVRPSAGGGGTAVKQASGGRDEIFQSLFKNISENTFTYTALTYVSQVHSRGYIKLRNTNPNCHPIIVPNFFDDPRDLDVLVEGLKIAHNISLTPTMQRFNARPNVSSIPPECAEFTHLSDDYLRCHARYFSVAGYHPAGTCKMGPANDSMAVVDASLRVYGVTGLRIVDASIMPIVVNGNTNAPTIMIAEKAADMIKKDYTNLYSSKNKQSSCRTKQGNPVQRSMTRSNN